MSTEKTQELIDWYAGTEGSEPLVQALRCIARLEDRVEELEKQVSTLEDREYEARYLRSKLNAGI